MELCADERNAYECKCLYRRGKYESPDDVAAVSHEIAQLEGALNKREHQRLFFFAIPLSVFVPIGTSIKKAALSTHDLNLEPPERREAMRAARKIIAPLLNEIETKKIKPQPYKFGLRGSKESDELAKRKGLQCHCGVCQCQPMDKYRRVEKSKAHDAAPVEANEIRITQQGNVRSYISYANGLFAEKHERGVVLKAMGNAISKAVTVAEILKHRVANLHQITQISSIETVDVYEPLEEGLDRIETKRHIPSIAIQLSLDPLNKDDPGYQSPIPAELVTTGFDDKEPRCPGASARRKKKSKAAAAGGASPSEAVAVDDDDGDAGGAAGQENAKSQANTAASAAAASSPPRDEHGESSSPVADGKPAARGEAAKRGRGTRGGRGAGRKPREDSKAEVVGADDGGSAAASDEAKAAVSPSAPSSAAKRASRSRKPRAKHPDESNGETSGDAHASAAVDRASPEHAQLEGEGDNGGRSSTSRGRVRGRGGRTGRGRSRGRGGRGDAASGIAGPDVPVATE
ncbi:hypothetical protein PybrP1_006058 [[Pythium] brassicae (nom. inval.)]|nr:hypothetical protein PybrP1_006058 [[Pythium] brassicae (nom. inval.)]